MNTSANNILETIISEVNSINDKIKGLNFLEILKNNLIEKFSYINDKNSSFNELNQIEKELNTDNRDITICIKFILNSSITSKKLIKENTLFLSLNESSSFDIYENEKNFVNILLFKNTGISIPKNTILNSKFNKNVLLIEIQYKDKDQILTN
tara:strand:- start:127 stop:585 length:459 start_codon:yes stop_codon:yes gene_type:complete